MRLVEVNPSETDVRQLVGGVLSHDVRHPERRREILLRKGTALTTADLRLLDRRDLAGVHVLVREPGDIAEDPAAARLARAVAGPGVLVERPHHGQVTLRAAVRGLVRVNQAGLDAVNACEGMLVFTAEGGRATDKGTSLGAAKVVPLLVPERTLEQVEAVCRAKGPVLEARSFQPRQVVLVVTDRVGGRALAQAKAHLSTKVAWFGSHLTSLPRAASPADVAAAFRAAVARGADLIFAAGGSTTDPTDRLFEGLRRAGGSIDQVGVPVDPGTACWIGHLEACPVLGLASCELFGRAGALDLILPRVLAGEALDQALVRALAYGGLLSGGPARVPAYELDRTHG
jgi:hypothetical protein